MFKKTKQISGVYLISNMLRKDSFLFETRVTNIHVYIYIYICVCVCVCACVRAKTNTLQLEHLQ